MWTRHGSHIRKGGTIRTILVSLAGAATLAAGLIVVRRQRKTEGRSKRERPSGEQTDRIVSLDRLRELAF